LARLLACDISPAAIAKADASWNTGGRDRIEFFSLDVRDSQAALPAQCDVVTISQLLWYVLPEFPDLLARIRRALKPGGHLVILQSFLLPQQQRYGREYMTKPEDLIAMVETAGFKPLKNVLIGKDPPNNFLLIAGNGQ
jgi:SAM-dependent methyltransferase